METLYGPASGAKQIKKILKDRWPKTKFSVGSETYSMGSSINVSWDLGPTRAMVEEIADRYQEGSFDGMTDSYNYNPTLVLTEGNDIKRLGGAKYVFCNRGEKTPELPNLRELYSKDVCERQGVQYAGNQTIICGDKWERFLEVGDQFWQAFQMADFYDADYAGIEFNNGGSGACFYRIKTAKKKS